jgi:hypothetical protein
MTGDPHADNLGNTGTAHIPNRGSPQIVEL